jgi:hypothetical protein
MIFFLKGRFLRIFMVKGHSLPSDSSLITAHSSLLIITHHFPVRIVNEFSVSCRSSHKLVEELTWGEYDISITKKYFSFSVNVIHFLF